MGFQFEISRYSPTSDKKSENNSKVYIWVIRKGSLHGVRGPKGMLRLPRPVTEPHPREGLPAHIADTSWQMLSEGHPSRDSISCFALLLSFSKLSFPLPASLILPSTIRMMFLLPMPANSTPFSNPTTLPSNGGRILLLSTKRNLKQRYKAQSHHPPLPQSRTVSLSKAAVPTSDAQRHKTSSLKQTHFKIRRIRMWFYKRAWVYLLPKEQSDFSPRAQLRAFPLSSLCLIKMSFLTPQRTSSSS